MSFPVYPLPSGMVLMPVSCSSQTILALGVPSQQGQCSSAMLRLATSPGKARSMLTALLWILVMVRWCLRTCRAAHIGSRRTPRRRLQLHHPRFLEFIVACESARLLFRSPAFWVQNMDTEDAVAAAVNLQRDAGLMSSNLQILCQFVTS